MAAPGSTSSGASELTRLAVAHRAERVPIVIIDITGNCNLHCEHCFSSSFSGTQLTYDEISRVISEVPGPARIHLLGGEPLLHPDLEKIIGLARARGHYTSLVTNGVALCRFGVDRLLSTGVAEIGFSLDGPDPETNDPIRGEGTFDQAWTALVATAERVTARGLDTFVSVSATAMRMNLPHLPRLVDRLRDSGVFIDLLSFAFLFEEGRAKQPGRLSVQQKSTVDPIEWLDTCGEICRRWKSALRLQHLNLRAPPLVHEYLTRTHGVFLLDSVVGCPALETRFGGRVCSNGKVYSCSREFLVERAKAEGHFPNEGVHHSELEAQGLGLFTQTEFRDTVRANLRPPDSAVCSECAWQDACVRCPIITMLGQAGSSILCTTVSQRALAAGPAEVRPSLAGPPPIDEDQPLPFRDDVYCRQERDGTIVYLCVGLERVVVFGPDLHAEEVYRSARAGRTVRGARAEYAQAHNRGPSGYDSVVQQLAAEGLTRLAGDA